MFTTFVETIALRDQYAGSIRTALNSNWIHHHGRFKIAVSDQAKNVVIECYQVFAQKRDVFFHNTQRTTA